jgi:hypothetical protein
MDASGKERSYATTRTKGPVRSLYASMRLAVKDLIATVLVAELRQLLYRFNEE